MLERFRSYEKQSKSVALGILSVSLLSSCIPSGADAATTPFGIYYRSENPSAFIVEHEQCHWDRAQREPDFWIKYWNNPEFSCAEERRCGVEPTEFPDVYPQCQDK